MKAVVVNEHGSIDKLVYTDFAEPEISPSEVLVKVNACGINHLDNMGKRRDSRYYHSTAPYTRLRDYWRNSRGWQCRDTDWGKVINTNLKGMFLLAKKVILGMISKG